ncbi:MAG: adenosylmethionine--8-amino-7-oxononanoate transaminase [Cyclobacteriaceae bacterium]
MPEEFNFSQSELDFDQHNIWHPYTSLTNPLPVYPVVSANGVRLKLKSGKELIDGMSSWWTAIHGYNVPELNEAATRQLDKMSHVMFGGITHAPAVELAQKLIEMSPSGLEKIFFCDSGSVSVEVAMKMAVQYQQAKGFSQKTKFMTFRNGYHGDTSAAMSVCDPENGMHHLFSSFLPKHFFAPAPAKRFNEIPDIDELSQLDSFFEKHADNSAAFILEPILQGAGGMRMYSPEYLNKVKSLCEKYDLLLIADEIATGFGRTGKLFACEHANISPDIMCVGKALTGGYLSLAATLCSTEVAEVICNGEAGVFMHGPTFMANPLSCAIANASLDLLLASNWQERVTNIEAQLKKELGPAADLKSVKEVRILGAVGVIELTDPVDVVKAQKFFVETGVWIRPFRNLIYIMPPYVISKADLTQITKAMTDYCTHIEIES